MCLPDNIHFLKTLAVYLFRRVDNDFFDKRQQSDRNIRKVRGTMLKKIRKNLLAALTEEANKQQPMTLLEKAFLAKSSETVDSGNKK